MKRAPQNLLQGQAGVYRVAAELCLRGFNPHFPAVDFGADLVIDGGVRIQVKASHRRCANPYPTGAYWFKLGRTAIRSRRQVWVNRTFTEECDFVVFWGIEDDRFWVVPASEVDDHQCLVLGPDPFFKNLDQAEVIRLRESGLHYEQIAEQMGCSAMTVSRRYRGLLSNPKKDLAVRVRRLENRWDLISDFLNITETQEDAQSQEEIAKEIS